METVVVLAMHGMPPADFPQEELAEFFRLHSMVHSGSGGDREDHRKRYAFLEDKMRRWPRNEQNDPFHGASRQLAAHLSRESGYEVVVGHNEFCAPDLYEALESAADKGAGKIIVVTPMMTRGGDHAEKDIPVVIDRFRTLCPEIDVVYAWPFDAARVARFLADHISNLA